MVSRGILELNIILQIEVDKKRNNNTTVNNMINLLSDEDLYNLLEDEHKKNLKTK